MLRCHHNVDNDRIWPSVDFATLHGSMRTSAILTLKSYNKEISQGIYFSADSFVLESRFVIHGFSPANDFKSFDQKLHLKHHNHWIRVTRQVDLLMEERRMVWIMERHMGWEVYQFQEVSLFNQGGRGGGACLGIERIAKSYCKTK